MLYRCNLRYAEMQILFQLNFNSGLRAKAILPSENRVAERETFSENLFGRTHGSSDSMDQAHNLSSRAKALKVNISFVCPIGVPESCKQLSKTMDNALQVFISGA